MKNDCGMLGVTALELSALFGILFAVDAHANNDFYRAIEKGATVRLTTMVVDDEGKPVNTSKGYAAMQYEEDANGNRTWEGYFDKYQGQTHCSDGYFSKESEYDSAGRLISERYLDRYNKLTNNAEGIAGWNGYYDAEGNLIITSKYDKDRNALPAEAQ